MFKNIVIVFLLSAFIVSGVHIHLNKTVVPVDNDAKVLYCRAIAISARAVIGFEMTKDAIKKNCKSFENVNILLGHDQADPDKTVGRVMRAQVMHDKEKDVDYIEIVFQVFTPDAIRKIKAGQYYYMSIGIGDVKTDDAAVNIFGEGMKRITRFEGLEVSFVSSPRDKYAKILEYSDKYEDVLE